MRYAEHLHAACEQRCKQTKGNGKQTKAAIGRRLNDEISRKQQVCVKPHPLAVDKALPAFAAERRAAALCYRSPVDGDQTVSKLLHHHPFWDRQTDTVPLPCGQCQRTDRHVKGFVHTSSQLFTTAGLLDSKLLLPLAFCQG